MSQLGGCVELWEQITEAKEEPLELRRKKIRIYVSGGKEKG